MADIHPRNKNVANTEKLYSHDRFTDLAIDYSFALKTNLGINLRKDIDSRHWLKRGTSAVINAKAEIATNSFITASTASCRSDDSYYFIPSLSLLPPNKSRYHLSSGSPLLARPKHPLSLCFLPGKDQPTQSSRMTWPDLTWQVGRASPQLSPQLPRHVAIIMAAKMKNQ